LVKKGSNNKSWISSYSPTQEEFENLCFTAVGQKVGELWLFVYVTSKQWYAIDLSSLILSWFIVKKGDTLHIIGFFYSGWTQWYIIAFVSYSGFCECLCNLFYLYLLHKSTFLLLLLWRAIILAYEAETLPKHIFGNVDYEYLIIRNSRNATLCWVVTIFRWIYFVVHPHTFIISTMNRYCNSWPTQQLVN